MASNLPGPAISVSAPPAKSGGFLTYLHWKSTLMVPSTSLLHGGCLFGRMSFRSTSKEVISPDSSRAALSLDLESRVKEPPADESPSAEHPLSAGSFLEAGSGPRRCPTLTQRKNSDFFAGS
eukprot:g5078.t1